MSKTAQIVTWIVVAVIVVGGGIWWWVASNNNASTGAGTSSAQTSTENVATTNGAGNVQSGSSDADIDQSMTNINAQMNGLSSDSANVDQSVQASQSAQ